MNITLRSFCAASLLACTVSAFADDIYYKSSTTDKLNQEAYKFTEATTDAEKTEGKTVYQLMVPHITSGFYLLDGETTLGTAEAATLAQTQVTTDGVTYTLDGTSLISPTKSEVDGVNITDGSKYALADLVNHVLLTLTVDNNTGEKTLKVEKPTNDNIRVGVPTYFYLNQTDNFYDYSKNNDLDPAMRLIKGEGNNYTFHCDIYGIHSALRIMEPLYQYYITKSSGGYTWQEGPYSPTCVNLGVEYGGTSIAHHTEYDWSSGSLQTTEGLALYESGTSCIDSSKPYSSSYTWFANNDTNSIEIKMYQGVKTGSIAVTAKLVDVNLNFRYDFDDPFVESDDLAYNGVLTISAYEFNADEVNDSNESTLLPTFTVQTSQTTDEDGSYTKTYDMTATEIVTKDGVDYVVYKATISGDFNAAFYIEGTKGETKTEFTGLTTDTDHLVEDWDVNGTATDIIDFTLSGEFLSASTAEGYPFYGTSTNGSEIYFYYNANDPSKSLVEFVSNGTYTGSAAIEVSDSECEVEYYNLNGVRVNATTPGLYIRRQGKQVSKVVIR
jgi:hypothetical protein